MNSNEIIKNIVLITIFSGLTYSCGADLTEDPGITASDEVELSYLREKALSGNVKEVKSLIEKANHLREYVFKNLISDLNLKISQMKLKELSTDTEQNEELRKNILKNIELINAYLERRTQKTVDLTYLREKALSGNVKEFENLIEKADHLREYTLKTLISDLSFKISQMELTDSNKQLREDILKNIELINAYLEKRKKKMSDEAENAKCREQANELLQLAIKGNVEKVELYLAKEECTILLPGVIQEIKNFVTGDDGKIKEKLVKDTDKYNKIKRCVELIQDKIKNYAQDTQDKLYELGRTSSPR